MEAGRILRRKNPKSAPARRIFAGEFHADFFAENLRGGEIDRSLKKF